MLGGTLAGRKPTKGKKSVKVAPVRVPIDASGQFGRHQFDDFEGLQRALTENQDQLAHSIYESLLSYGIGREIEFVDDKELETILNRLKSNNYPLKEILFEVISSKTFATK